MNLKINIKPRCKHCDKEMKNGQDDMWNRTVLPIMDGDIMFAVWTCSERCLRKVLNQRQKERKQ